MIVSHAKKFIFLHNPKAAGTSLRNALEPYHDHPRRFWGVERDRYFGGTVDMAHLRAWELPVVAPGLFAEWDSFNTLVVVRDPLSRFYSACFEHFRNFRPDTGFHTLSVHARIRLVQQLVQGDLTSATARGNPEYVHFSLQTWFTHFGPRRMARHIVPIRSEADDLAEVYRLLGVPYVEMPPLNRGVGAPWPAEGDPVINKFVRAFYAADYALLESLPPA